MKKYFTWGKILNFVLILLSWMILGAIIVLRKGKLIFSNYLTEVEYSNAKLSEIKRLLSTEFVRPTDLDEKKEEMLENAIAGYVKGLDDPYTMYLTKPNNEILHNALTEQSWIEGIGVYLEKEKNAESLVISDVIKNGSADNAGLQKGDKIFSIDGVLVKDLSVSEGIELIRGEQGTTVTLDIQRNTESGQSDFSLTLSRTPITIPSVEAELQEYEGKKIGIFTISSISEHTTQVFVEECLDFIKQGMEGILLDLRGNGGGYLEEASKFLGHFIPKGEITVKNKYYAFSDKDYTSKGFWELKEYPVVVVIDQMTASASEIIALTLQEHHAKIVGKQSFGKGTIQTVQEFSDGSSLKYTIGERFSPEGVSVNGTGITPDNEVDFDAKAYLEDHIDTQLDEAKKTLATLI